ncbi:MAG: hypothetical protein ACE5JD_10470 [Candidatus Methylomirabilia bacterium]
MADELTERLDRLEKAIRRAAQLISRLKAERSRAEGDRAILERRLADQAEEIENLHASGAALHEELEELSHLRKERKAILSQVEGILGELDQLDLT